MSTDKPTAAERLASTKPGCTCELCAMYHGDQAPSADDLVISRLQRELASEKRHRLGVEHLLGLATVETCDGWNAPRLAELLTRERDELRRELRELKAKLKDPTHVRAAVLVGDIVPPVDLVWLHDSHGAVAAKVVEEREACAKVADEFHSGAADYRPGVCCSWWAAHSSIAAAIRDRGAA